MRRLLILALLCVVPAFGAGTNTPIKLIGGCAAVSTTCTAPTVAVGDIMVVFAFRTATTAPTLATNYTSVATASASSSSFRTGCHVATSTSDGTGTWANATDVALLVYRAELATTSANCVSLGVGGNANASSTTSTINYPAITMTNSSGTSVIIGFSGSSASTCTPTGMTSEQNSGTAIIANDTNGGGTAWSSTNCTGTTGNSKTNVVEILAAPVDLVYEMTDRLSVVDCYIDIASSLADGTTMTEAIMTGGTHGACHTGTEWNGSGTFTGISVNRRNLPRTFDVYVRGTGEYIRSSAVRSMRIDHSTGGATFEAAEMTFPSGHYNATACGFWTPGQPNSTAASGLNDVAEFQGGTSGHALIMQMNPNLLGAGSPPFLYTVGIESGMTGSTVHSTYVQVTPGKTLYWCLYADYWSGVSRLSLFDPITYSLVASTSLAQSVTPEKIGNFNIGQNEGGICSGACNAYSYIENVVIDYTTAIFPIGPGPKRWNLPLIKSATSPSGHCAACDMSELEIPTEGEITNDSLR